MFVAHVIFLLESMTLELHENKAFSFSIFPPGLHRRTVGLS